MRVLVCGGRDFWDRLGAFAALDALHEETPIETLISGCARGADSVGIEWAEQMGIRVERFPADWKAHGRAAGPIRNQQMLDEGFPDLVVAFPGGAGTADMVKKAREAGVKVKRL